MDLIAQRVINSKIKSCSVQRQLRHLLLHYPAFCFQFKFRIGIRSWLFDKLFIPQPFAAKIFGSTKINGGMVCFHPFGSVITVLIIGGSTLRILDYRYNSSKLKKSKWPLCVHLASKLYMAHLEFLGLLALNFIKSQTACNICQTLFVLSIIWISCRIYKNCTDKKRIIKIVDVHKKIRID